MAKTLYELAMEYLNQGMPDITQTPRVTPPEINPPGLFPQPPVNPITKILPIQGGGGGGNNVYNSDPNSTRTKSNYSPYSYRQAEAKSGVGIPSGILSDSSFLYPPQTKVGNMINNSFIGKGLDYLGSKIPVNRRAILENELLGSGMQLNDIGQFVSDGGDINKADGSNIMAGYNAAKVTQETFDKRRATIEKNMKDPKQKAAKLAALDAAEKSFFGAKTKADMVFDDKSLAKDPTYKSLANKIAIENAINLEKEDDENIDIFDPNNKIKNTSVFTKTPTDVFYDDFPDTITDTDNNDFDGITSITDPTITSDVVDEFNVPSDQVINAGGTAPGGGYTTDYYGGNPVIDAGGTAPGGGYTTDYYGGNPVIDAGGTAPGGGYSSDYYGGGNNSVIDAGGTAPGGGYSSDYYGGSDGYDFSDFDDGDTSKADPTGTGNFSDTITGNDTSPGATGGEGGAGTGGSTKIVCTMMNESYGFGSFRNKIWMKFHKDLAPEYQKGYHKIFLPLIKIAKRNKIVKKVLEHIAIHSTIDMRQATRGKTHLLGRLYRKILLPLCYFVGKNG